jgi:hypothetical protein
VSVVPSERFPAMLHPVRWQGRTSEEYHDF